MNTLEQVLDLRKKQAEFFATGKTREIDFRRESLKRLKGSIKAHEDDIKKALRLDLNKSSFESYATEIGLVLNEINTFINKVSRWAKSQRIGTSVFAFPSKSFVVPEPYGQVFIISPWNYPFQLPMVPLVGAIAAGNVVIIRQSRFSPETNKVVREILSETFPQELAAIIETDLEVAEEVLRLSWDMIFFTGSTPVGKKIYSSAAVNLTPVVLELGSKSPVVVDEDASIGLAARHIIWGKLINAGQTCISPDYLFVHEKIKDKLIVRLKNEIIKMYGAKPLDNPDYPRLISGKAFDRMLSYLENKQIITGGSSDREKLSVEPTLIEARQDDKCMSEEIFGPVLPVMPFRDIEEVIWFINSRPRPLSIYFYSRNRKSQRKMQHNTTSGAFLVNEMIVHFANNNLPFGGVGESGVGRYHGRESFRAFSNMKAVMKNNTGIDFPLRYPPFGKKERIIKWLIK